MGVFATVDLDNVESEIKLSQETVLRLLDNEDRALSRLGEVETIDDQAERLDEMAKLILECESIELLAKELGDIVGRAKKRMVQVKDKVKVQALTEVEGLGGEFEAKDFKFKVRTNPVRVVVDDLSVVPKKYRNEPKPLPPWEEWDVDKNIVKAALTREKVQSIAGVHLEQTNRIEVKPR